MTIVYSIGDNHLDSNEYVDLFRRRFTADLDVHQVADAIAKSINITARNDGNLVGCCRIVTDGYLFSAIAEILTDPKASNDVAPNLLRLAGESSPVSIMMGVQAVDEGLMTRLNWMRGPTVYYLRKPLQKS